MITKPFVFTGASKSQLGWDFIGMIDSGRIKEYVDDGSDITRIYRHQLVARTCKYEVLPGPGKLLRWSVPASRGHDDLLISTALTARLDAMDWRDRTARGSDVGNARVVHRPDPSAGTAAKLPDPHRG